MGWDHTSKIESWFFLFTRKKNPKSPRIAFFPFLVFHLYPHFISCTCPHHPLNKQVAEPLTLIGEIVETRVKNTRLWTDIKYVRSVGITRSSCVCYLSFLHSEGEFREAKLVQWELGFKPWFEQIPRVQNYSKIEPTTQPNQQIKNHPKMTTKITKKGNFRLGDENKWSTNLISWLPSPCQITSHS
jgi:hypothetical protein